MQKADKNETVFSNNTQSCAELLQSVPARLLPWYAEHARQLPWRSDREPYHVWLSEIMLQQTRAEAVIRYYHRFLEELPAIRDLAAVPDDCLMKLWEGLGYYSRARNLKKAALQIEERFGGVFPTDYADIRSLPGIGPYTAGAIASICFSQPVPAVDGNVLRVVSRLIRYEKSVDTQAAKNEIAQMLQAIYTPQNSGLLTQSLMELGACICVPNGQPKCGSCPLSDVCRANAGGVQTQYPKRDEKRARRKEKKTVLILSCGGKFAIQKRSETGLLAGLWEFPNRPTVAESDEDCLKEAAAFAASLGAVIQQPLRQIRYTHIFTHVEWHMTGCCFACGKLPEGMVHAAVGELEEVYALPSAFRPFLQAVKDEA